MKQLSTYILICFCIQFANAQITLNSSNNFEIGENFAFNHVSGLDEFMPGDAGENITWDFTNIVTTDVLSGIVVDAADMPYFYLAPEATNGRIYDVDYAELFYKSTDMAQMFYGSAIFINNDTLKYFYTDPEEFLRYPLSYGDSYSDDYAGLIEWASGSTPPAVRTGTILVTADAYGTLTTPAGTFNNALRLNLIRTFLDNNNPASEITQNIFVWYESESNFRIVTYSESTLPDGNTSAAYQYLDAAPSYTSSPFAKEINLSIFPNPASDKINLTYSLLESADIVTSVTNIIGQEVMQIANKKQMVGFHQRNIDIGNLPDGTYFLNMVVDGKMATHKLLVQR